jgi:hypothetical protein
VYLLTDKDGDELATWRVEYSEGPTDPPSLVESGESVSYSVAPSTW